MTKNKRVHEIISDMQDKENEEIHNLLRALTSVKSIAVTIDQIQNLQYELNDAMVQVYENCQKMYSLAVESSKGSLGSIKDLNDKKIPSYDLKGEEVTDNKSGPNYALEFFRLKQESAQIGYSPLLKRATIIPVSPDRKPTIKLESNANGNLHIEELSENDSSDAESEAKKSKNASNTRQSQSSSDSETDNNTKRRESKVQRIQNQERKSSTGTDQSNADALSGISINANFGIYELRGANLPGVVGEED